MPRYCKSRQQPLHRAGLLLLGRASNHSYRAREKGISDGEMTPLVSGTEVMAALREFECHDALTAIEAEEMLPTTWRE